MMETLQAQSALLIVQQHRMAMLERNTRIMGDHLRMHNAKFDCLVVVKPEVVNFSQWLPVERFHLPLIELVRDIVVPHYTFPEDLVAPGEVSPPEYYEDQTWEDGDWAERQPGDGMPELEEFGPQGWGPEWDAWDA
jgi:hypothetical protein